MKNIVHQIKTQGLLSFVRSFLFSNTSTKQTIMKNTFWLFVAEGVNKGLMFLLTILLARYLGASGYGQFAFAMSFTSLFAVVADFGLSTLLIREVARDNTKASSYVSNIAVIKLFLAVITFVLIVVSVQFMGKDSSVNWLVYLFGIYVILNSFAEFLRSVFRAFEKMEYEAYSKIVQGLVLFGLGGAIILMKQNITWVIIAFIISAICSCIIRPNTIKLNYNLDLSHAVDLVKQSWPFALSIIFINIYMYTDTIMLSHIISDEAAGIYSAAYRIAYTVVMFAAILSAVLLPIISKRKKMSKRELIKIYSLFFVTGILINLIIFIGSKQIIEMLLGPEYSDAIIILKILSIATFLSFIFNAGMVILNATHNQKWFFIATGVASLINVTLNLFIIGKYSYYGAATTTIIAELIGSVICIVAVYLNIFRKAN